MKIPTVDIVKNTIKKTDLITKKSKSTDLKSIKNYAQYMSEYGLK